MSAYKIMMLTLVAAIGIVAIRTRLNESKPKDHAAAKEKEEKDADPDSDRAGMGQEMGVSSPIAAPKRLGTGLRVKP
jgi:hypothetical protein